LPAPSEGKGYHDRGIRGVGLQAGKIVYDQRRTWQPTPATAP
jgi:hypothetical protein